MNGTAPEVERASLSAHAGVSPTILHADACCAMFPLRPDMPPDLTTEWTRIQQLHATEGDAAWAWFIERYEPLVQSMLGKRIAPGRVEAATHEFWGYLWHSRAISRADSHRSFRGYLFGILHRFALVWQRDQTRMPRPTQADLDRAAAAPAESADDLTLWAMDCLRNGLEQLERRFPVDAQLLKRFYGFMTFDAEGPVSVSALAKLLQKSPASIQQHLSRGRARLRNLMAADLRRTVASAAGHAAEASLLFELLRKRYPDLQD